MSPLEVNCIGCLASAFFFGRTCGFKIMQGGGFFMPPLEMMQIRFKSIVRVSQQNVGDFELEILNWRFEDAVKDML